MRNLRNPKLELGEVRIKDIKLNHMSRDDIPALLTGLQYWVRFLRSGIDFYKLSSRIVRLNIREYHK